VFKLPEVWPFLWSEKVPSFEPCLFGDKSEKNWASRLVRNACFCWGSTFDEYRSASTFFPEIFGSVFWRSWVSLDLFVSIPSKMLLMCLDGLFSFWLFPLFDHSYLFEFCRNFLDWVMASEHYPNESKDFSLIFLGYVSVILLYCSLFKFFSSSTRY
jgi:hypothetical protein